MFVYYLFGDNWYGGIALASGKRSLALTHFYFPGNTIKAIEVALRFSCTFSSEPLIRLIFLPDQILQDYKN